MEYQTAVFTVLKGSIIYFARDMMKWITGILWMLVFTSAKAQFREANVLEGEFGVAVGAAHYFGDLNTRASLNRPKLSVSALFRKQFGDYIALRVQGTFAQLGYSDIYSENEAQKLRNLSFNTNIAELALLGDFNFFRFIPGDKDFRFTPYTTLGMGFFTYDPYAFLNGDKYYLRPLGTEGQGSAAFPDRKEYGTMAFVFPLGIGIKYNLTPKTNVTLELLHRFTTTDYLDDVSTTYAGLDAFEPLPNGDMSPAMLLQDRSYEVTAVPIGIKGRQRGISTRKDQYVTLSLGITINLTSYNCPPTR
ncbi:MAG: DUF6089 family protein [Chitinophagaceae bacterium]|nr:DUF6089 family protein [Chitinophagaceae bacterium]